MIKSFVRKRCYSIGAEKKGVMFIDTETSGLGATPRLLQLGWQLRDFHDGQLFNSFSSYIQPEPPKFIITRQATGIHGITLRKLITEGKDLRYVLSLLRDDLLKADLVIAHNMPYDERVMKGTLDLVQDSNLTSLWNEKEKACTMAMARSLPQFVKKSSLGVVFESLTGRKPLEGAHSAHVDVEMCAICYFELKKLKLEETRLEKVSIHHS